MKNFQMYPVYPDHQHNIPVASYVGKLTEKALQRLNHSNFDDIESYTARSALEITGDNLEDLLAYDDLFLDYFNAFLSLPVFPQALHYNRLTGDFEDVRSNDTGLENDEPAPYGVPDEERDKLLEWARNERLPLFLSTQLFREFKICKLLLRPLDDRYSASRGSSQQIRGYSRQSESYVSSLSNSGDNSGHDEINDEDLVFMQGAFHHSGLFKYQRPGSRAVSVPTRMDLVGDFFIRGSTETATQETTSRNPTKSASIQKKLRELNSNEENEDDIPDGRKHSIVKFDTSESKSHKSSKHSREKRVKSEAEEAFMRQARALSAPLNYDDYMRHPMFGDFDFLFGEDEPDPDGHVYVTFQDEHVSDAQTETDIRHMEGRLKMSLQQLKEQVLGTHDGMEGFKEFLMDTAGNQLINFWLDCEYYKDAMEDFDEVMNMEIRNRLFRDIQDKYKMNLTENARTQIQKAATNAHLSHTVFIRTQYDVLRRLRAYWVPRYLIHMERLRELRSIGAMVGIKVIHPENKNKHSVPFLPSISLVNSMPVQPDDLLTYSKTKSWDFLCKGGRRLDSRISSAKLKPGITPPTPIRLTKDRFLIALTSDKMAGGPFQRYLERQEDKSLLSSLLFWQDVTDYGKAEDRSADRLLRLASAWNIFNRYFSNDCISCIGVSEDDRATLHKCLLNAKDYIEATIFLKTKSRVVERLERAWIRYLKEDLKTFLDSHVLDGSMTPPSTADVIEITVTNNELIIYRPDPWVKSTEIPQPTPPSRVSTTESQRAARLRQALSEQIDPEKRAEMRAKARQRRKEMERERRKAIRAAYRRVREAKQKKTPDRKDDDDDMEYDIEGEKKSSRPPPPFTDMTHNKQIMTNYRKYLQETEEKEKLNMVSLYFDVENYLNFGNSKSDNKKKDSHAHFIYKTYLDSHGKKHLTFEKLNNKITDRPKTAALKEMQSNIIPKIEESFRNYIIEKASEHGMEPREFAGLSQAELSLRMGTETSLMGGTWKKGRKGKEDESMAYESWDDVTLDSAAESTPGKDSRGGKDLRKIRELALDPCITVNVYETDGSDLKKHRKVRFAKDDSDSAGFTRQQEENGKGQSAGQDTSHTGKSTGHNARRGRKHKTGRTQPTKEDKDEFFKALKQSAAGHLTLPMLYFYKYLLKHGEEDGTPLIDKDLFFYIEVQKFKDANHAYSDEDLLRKKVQAIMECFLESVTAPALQIDISATVHEKALRAAQKYLAGKDVMPSIFDEAQLVVFKELLPYWAGFRRTFQQPDDPTKRPVTKYQKLLKKRLDNIENYEVPQNEFSFPSIPEGSVAAYSFSLSEGVRWREVSSDEAASLMGSPIDRAETSTTFRGGNKHNSNLSLEQLKKRRKSHSHMNLQGFSKSGQSSENSTIPPVAVKD